MIALKLKQQANQQAQPQNIQQSGAWRRVQTDQQELNQDLPPQIKLSFPDPNDIMYFEVVVKPDENVWSGGQFPFTVSVSDEYPIQPPKVLCKKRIYHPNIDLEGKVCLNILREDWKPVSSLKDVLFGLLFLFLAPNPSDPLNKEAAENMLKDQKKFQQTVRDTMKGNTYGGVQFDRVI